MTEEKKIKIREAFSKLEGILAVDNDIEIHSLDATEKESFLLDKNDLVTLVQGNSPSFGLMQKEPFESCGNYNGSYGTWDWSNRKLKELSMNDLWKMHLQMKNQYQ